MKKAIIFGLIVLSLGLSAVPAQDNSGPCAHGGWIEDKDPKGTNIRNAPGLHGKVLAIVPHSNSPETDVMVDIIGYSNGWVKITAAGNQEGTFGFSGPGWVSAKKVTTGVEHASGKPAPLYAEPKRSSKKVGQVPNYADILIVGFDCFGLKIRYKGISGWLYSDDICGNVLTTCP